MLKKFCILVMVFCITSIVFAINGVKLNDLNSIVKFMLNHNTKLKSIEKEISSAKSRIPYSSKRPDPVLKYSYFFENVETRVGAQNQKFGIAQKFITGGKLRIKSKKSSIIVKKLQQKYYETASKLVFDLKKAYFENYLLRIQLQITTEIFQLMKYFESVANTKYAIGKFNQSSLIQLQVETGKLEDNINQLKDLIKPSLEKINFLINSKNENVTFPSNVNIIDLKVNSDVLFKWIKESNPTVKKLKYMSKIADYDKILAYKKNVPNITLGIDYADVNDSIYGNPPGNGNDPLMVMLSMNLPLQKSKNNALGKSFKLISESYKEKVINKYNQLKYEVELAYYKYIDAKRKIEFYRDDLIPKIQQSLKVVQTDFSSGLVDFITIMEPLRSLLMFSLSYHKYIVVHRIQIAYIEFLAGKSLPQKWYSYKTSKKMLLNEMRRNNENKKK